MCRSPPRGRPSKWRSFSCWRSFTPQLSLGIIWLTLSNRRLLYRIAALACLAIFYLRIAPADWWASELTYRMSQFEWFYLLWTQLAIVGGSLWVARRQGLQIAGGPNVGAEASGGRPPNSILSDVSCVGALIAIPLMLSGGFPIAGAWIYVSERAALRMSALGSAFAFEALLALALILSASWRWMVIAAAPALAWALGDGVELLFFQGSSAKHIPLAAMTHMLILMTSFGVARRCGYHLVKRESIGAQFADFFTAGRIAGLARWLFAGALVAALIVAARVLELGSLLAFDSRLPGWMLSATALTLVTIWVWLSPAPLISRVLLLGIGIYYGYGRQDERAFLFLHCLAVSAPLLYLRRGNIRLATRPWHSPTIEFDGLPRAGWRDGLLITAVIAMAMILVRNSSPRGFIAMESLFITFAVMVLAGLRAEFGSNRSYFWMGVRLTAPLCAALGFAINPRRNYLLLDSEFFATLCYSYTLLLATLLGVLRWSGFRLVQQTSRAALPPSKTDAAPSELALQAK